MASTKPRTVDEIVTEENKEAVASGLDDYAKAGITPAYAAPGAKGLKPALRPLTVEALTGQHEVGETLTVRDSKSMPEINKVTKPISLYTESCNACRFKGSRAQCQSCAVYMEFEKNRGK